MEGSGQRQSRPRRGDESEGCCSRYEAGLRSGGAARTSGCLRGWEASIGAMRSKFCSPAPRPPAIQILEICVDWCRIDMHVYGRAEGLPQLLPLLSPTRKAPGEWAGRRDLQSTAGLEHSAPGAESVRKRCTKTQPTEPPRVTRRAALQPERLGEERAHQQD